MLFSITFEDNGQPRKSKKQTKNPLLVADTTSATAFVWLSIHCIGTQERKQLLIFNQEVLKYFDFASCDVCIHSLDFAYKRLVLCIHYLILITLCGKQLHPYIRSICGRHADQSRSANKKEAKHVTDSASLSPKQCPASAWSRVSASTTKRAKTSKQKLVFVFLADCTIYLQ